MNDGRVTKINGDHVEDYKRLMNYRKSKGKKFSKGGGIIKCSGKCKQWYHFESEGLSRKEFEMFMELDDKVEWSCHICKRNKDEHDTEVSLLLAKIDSLEASECENKKKIIQCESIIATLKENLKKVCVINKDLSSEVGQIPTEIRDSVIDNDEITGNRKKMALVLTDVYGRHVKKRLWHELWRDNFVVKEEFFNRKTLQDWKNLLKEKHEEFIEGDVVVLLVGRRDIFSKKVSEMLRHLEELLTELKDGVIAILVGVSRRYDLSEKHGLNKDIDLVNDKFSRIASKMSHVGFVNVDYLSKKDFCNDQKYLNRNGTTQVVLGIVDALRNVCKRNGN